MLGSGVVVAEPVGLAVEVEHDGSVEEPVEHRGGDGGVAAECSRSSWTLLPMCRGTTG